MKSVISEKEYDQYLKEALYASPVRFCIGAIGMYLLISFAFDLIGGTLSFDLKSILLNLGISVTWGILFTLLFLPVMKISTKKIVSYQIDNLIDDDSYRIYIPCSYKKSKHNSIGGILYIGIDCIYFKPHKINIGASVIEWKNLENLEITVQKQNVPLLTKLLYRNIPDCLLFKAGNRMANFIVPYPQKIIQACNNEGILNK
jgi:hypothetical protein